MTRPTFVCALVMLAVGLAASAADFPLAFRTIPAQDVMSFPGNVGNFGQLRLDKPAGLKREPKAISQHPLYGECPDSPGGGVFIFRLDESRGDGKGYDRLIVDMNQNGDLTDDSVAQRTSPSSDRRATTAEQVMFGPLQVPADKTVAGGRPIYFAQAYLLNRQLASSRRPAQELFFGQLTLKAGWYLDTTVRLSGVNYKVGVLDGNGNFRLGDVSQVQTANNSAQKTCISGRVTACWLMPIARAGLKMMCLRARLARSAQPFISIRRLTRWP